MTMMTYSEGIREGMSIRMRENPNVVLFGEDVGAYGGCFGVSAGMFDEFGPRGAEDEREGFWTDLSEVPDEQYRDEDEPKQTQEVIVPPAQEPYGPGIVPPEEI